MQIGPLGDWITWHGMKIALCTFNTDFAIAIEHYPIQSAIGVWFVNGVNLSSANQGWQYNWEIFDHKSSPLDSQKINGMVWYGIYLYIQPSILHMKLDPNSITGLITRPSAQHKRQSICPWWRHQMGAFSALQALCVGNSPVPMNSPHKGQGRGALMFFICAWINDWVNNREAGDLRRYCGHYDVSVMLIKYFTMWIRKYADI